SKVCNVIGELGGNIISVNHERNTPATQINGCQLHVEMETRNHQHIADIKAGLRKEGFEVVE
ncbi:MAG: threonine ammonia-lyase, partial [Paramuribaculum sp.]|nr:threonine ammonia-lyase [Paramuribaculum sp.]